MRSNLLMLHITLLAFFPFFISISSESSQQFVTEDIRNHIFQEAMHQRWAKWVIVYPVLLLQDESSCFKAICMEKRCFISEGGKKRNTITMATSLRWRHFEMVIKKKKIKYQIQGIQLSKWKLWQWRLGKELFTLFSSI